MTKQNCNCSLCQLRAQEDEVTLTPLTPEVDVNMMAAPCNCSLCLLRAQDPEVETSKDLASVYDEMHRLTKFPMHDQAGAVALLDGFVDARKAAIAAKQAGQQRVQGAAETAPKRHKGVQDTVTVSVYLDTGVVCEYDVATPESAREHAAAIVATGYVHTAAGYSTHYPAHRVRKVKFGPGVTTNYPDRVRGI